MCSKVDRKASLHPDWALPVCSLNHSRIFRLGHLDGSTEDGIRWRTGCNRHLRSGLFKVPPANQLEAGRVGSQSAAHPWSAHTPVAAWQVDPGTNAVKHFCCKTKFKANLFYSILAN